MLKIKNLNVSYGKMQVLFDVSVNIEKGKIVTILGANGAGKSTLMKAISGTLDNVSGEILFNGEDITKRNYYQIVKLGISHVPEGREVFPQLSVKDNLLMGAFIRKDKEKIKSDMEWVYDHFPILRERMNQLAGTLSGGQQQMLAIGRGLMAKPKILILDEPSLGLAPKVVDEIYVKIKEINEQQGTTILLVEQNIKKALAVSHSGYVIENGRVVYEGTSEEISQNNEIINIYLGNKVM